MDDAHLQELKQRAPGLAAIYHAGRETILRAADLEAWPDTALLTKLATVGTSVRVTPGASATVSLTTKVLR